jgi:capsular polysaccharide transport system ATP-binding protein
VIIVDRVTKVYASRQGPRTVLDNVMLTIRKGEHVGIIGRNGSGKSTLIRLISGVEMPTSGRVTRDISVSWPLAFGGAFQSHLTGVDNLRFVCRIYGIDYRRACSYVEDFSELGSYLREPVRLYSSGMRARLAFALSLAIDFDCFLIDEVIAVGDSRFHERCRVELFEKRRDRALILVSHDPQTVSSHCNRAAVLVNGKLKPFRRVEDAQAFYLTTMA